MKKRLESYQKGFTLLEMLLVIAMIAILAGIVIVAINPGRQLAQARNAQRASDLRAIHSAVNQYYIDNKEWPAGLSQTEIDGTMLDICKMGEPEVDCISLDILVPTYISTIPVDPQNVASSDGLINTAHAQATNLTGYRIGINPTSETLNLYAVNSNEYDLEEVQIMAECGDTADARCWTSIESPTIAWGPVGLLTNAQSTTNGRLNTEILIARDESFPAAQYCHDLDAGGYTDWYLPARDQLWNAWDQSGSTAKTLFFVGTMYWASNEFPTLKETSASYLNTVLNTHLMNQYKNVTNYSVRCLR